VTAGTRSGSPERTIGVVIRTLNESEFIAACLETLHGQGGGFDLDILVVDSGSTDDTIELARSNGARIVSIAANEFDYSKALNLGIEHVRGDIVVSLSAHAIPVDEQWLERMVAPFEDPQVAGVAARHVPWPGAPWQEVYRLRHQFPETPRVFARGADASSIVFSNAASAIRRRVWDEEPFTLPASEDLDWALRVLAAGRSIVYEAAAAVRHSHDESPRAQALRMIDINRAAVDPASRTLQRTLREAASMLFHDSRAISSLDEPIRRKLAYFVELLRMVGFYVVDFSRSGTTAERRRENDARRSSGNGSASAPQTASRRPT
jgi:glycosyltransferase involved in cell wall biosynthesis